MPAVIPIAAAAAAAATSIVIGGGVAGAIAGVLVAMTISFVGGRLFPVKPPRYDFQQAASGILIQTNSPIEPHKIIYGKTRVSGNVVAKVTTNSGTTYSGGTREGNNPFYHSIVVFAGHEIDSFETIYLGDTALTLDSNGWVTNAPYFKDGASYVRIKQHLGAEDQSADSLAVANIPGWDSNCRGRGCAYLYVIMEFNAEIFQSGVPNISAVIKGKKVFDPRDDSTAWSDNAVLCIRDYLVSDYGFGVPSTRIDDDLASANATICEEAVDLQAGGTQSRYAINGFLSTDHTPLDNLQQLSSAVAAPITYVQGVFRINVAVYDTPTLTLTDDMISGAMTVNPRTTRKELFNAVQGVFADPEKNYQPTSFPIVTNATYEANDNGERIIRDLQLPFEVSAERAQRLAKILLEKSRQGIVIEMTLNMEALQFAVWDTFTYTNPTLGWSSKVFRVINWHFSPKSGISITAQEESSASYDWNEGEATIIDTAPDTNLPDPFSVNPPGTPIVTEVLYSTIGSSGVKSKAVISWGASDDAFVRWYQLEYKMQADTDYLALAPLSYNVTSATLFDLEPGQYNIRVKAVNTIGISSSYAAVTAQIYGLTALPQNISNFSLNAINNNAHLTWDAIPEADLDVLVGGYVRIRYSPDITGSATWSSAIDIAPDLPGIATSAVVPLLNGTYFAKAVDSTGNESLTAAEIISTVSNIVKMNIVETLTEDPTFGGTKTNMTVSGGVLSLSANGSVYYTSGTYESSTYIDIGKVATSRVTFAVLASTYNSVDLFDGREGLFDDADGLFDGDDVSGIAVKAYISTTDDDPAGTPTWSAWRQFFVGDFTGRAYKFKIEVNSQNESYNIDISELSFTVDMPDIVDRGSDTTSSGALKTISFNYPFVISSPLVGVTILNAATGDYLDITNIDSDSFDVGVKNVAGTYVVRNIHWDAKGY